MRDGNLKSIWEEELSTFKPRQAALTEGEVYDVLIVGGGITGLTTALLLQQSGRRCILAEAKSIGFGTSGGTTAHLNTILDTPYYEIASKFSKEDTNLVAGATKEAIQLIQDLVKEYNIECDFDYKPGYLFAQNDDEVKELDKIVSSTSDVGVDISYTNEIPLAFDFVKACRIERQAQLDIGRYLVGLASAFESKGGIILDNCLVKSIDSTTNHVAYTSRGSISAQAVVYATHIPPGLNILHLRCAPYRSYAAAVTLSDGKYPNALIYDLKEPYHYFRSQNISGKTYLIAGGFDHKTGHKDNTEASLLELEAYIREHVSVAAIDYMWSSQYYVPADGLPYIGRLPGHDTIFTATGFNGNGILLGSLSGRIIADIINGRKTDYERLFDPNRIKPIAGFTAFVKENADVVSQFIGKRFSYEDISSLVSLAPGQAMLAELDGKKVAIYKDDQGKVFALDPVCPHAKCIVAWNSAEKTWDCPCHGGRYAIDGSLLTGPATKGLQNIDLTSTQ
ncbi:MAG: hypothetical protein BGO70_08065 [Bacteroidetes bacterium 43-93]|nr:FAD-dependent oxidoreductase [Bacteroidota bacterium]OJW97724.1 MAG: hypothetical protein BGO70_08065 [Bacteroidetes bacterium 43-93]